MKKMLVCAAFVLLILGSGTAQAVWVPVDFSSVTTTADITLPNSFSLSGVTFSYDNLGSSADFATVDTSGIFGTTYGALLFDFSGPTTGLQLDFALFDTSQAPVLDDALIALLKDGNTEQTVSVTATFDPISQMEVGSLFYTGASFNQASLFFSVDEPFFSAGNISYQRAAAVPEPLSLFLLAVSMAGVLWRGRLKKILAHGFSGIAG